MTIKQNNKNTTDMKNFANNTFWRRAAITLLLAVITTTAALAQGNTLTMVNAKNTVWSNMKKLLYSESDSTGRPGFNFRSLFADDDSPYIAKAIAQGGQVSISDLCLQTTIHPVHHK